MVILHLFFLTSQLKILNKMHKNKNLKAISYGEILFDVFEKEKKIGGAPLNLALRIKSFGLDVAVISAIGNDQNGIELKNYIEKNGINTQSIITVPNHKTGVVNVFLDERGSATYDIAFPAAWDFININEEIKSIVQEAEIFFFGSLACRNEVSKNTLFEILESNVKMFKVFDVNLRAPHYKIEVLEELMKKSDFIKFNDDEILEIASIMGTSSVQLEDNIWFIAEKTNTKSICVTRGKHGSILLWDGKIYYNEGYTVKVTDTVGAGDSFLAALITKLNETKNPQFSLDFASAVGAIVASKRGANPKIKKTEIEYFLEKEIL